MFRVHGVEEVIGHLGVGIDLIRSAEAARGMGVKAIL
jgi:hypothetical protein